MNLQFSATYQCFFILEGVTANTATCYPIADDVSIISAISNILKRIIEKAPSRVIFGSDYGGCSQRQHIELIKGLHLEKSVEEDIFWNNAVKIYQLQ